MAGNNKTIETQNIYNSPDKEGFGMFIVKGAIKGSEYRPPRQVADQNAFRKVQPVGIISLEAEGISVLFSTISDMTVFLLDDFEIKTLVDDHG